MTHDNNAVRIKREVLIRIARLFLQGRLLEEIDRIPLAMHPRDRQPTRCCIYKGRALAKYRCMASLGFAAEQEEDELTPLSDYARRALDGQPRVKAPSPLTVLETACSACVSSRYFATDACRNCTARSCHTSCPADAIAFDQGRAVIDPEKCRNCGRCLQACPFHAIIRVPIPCEEACPVGAVMKDQHGRVKIDMHKCISCGKCIQECPFGAVMETSEMLPVLNAIGSERPVVAMLAPAVVGQFPVPFGKLITAIRRLGFDQVVEVADGAHETARREAAELQERLAEGQLFMTSSCCPAYVDAVRKHIPDLLPYVSHTPTPMHLTAEQVTREQPGAVRVFLGPCVAKRAEARQDPLVDHVITFEELGALFVAAGIEVDECEEADLSADAGLQAGRGFPVSGGVTAAVRQQLPADADCTTMLLDGLNKKSLNLLKVYSRGKCPVNFIEVMACEGGCLAGPCALETPGRAQKRLDELRARVCTSHPSP